MCTWDLKKKQLKAKTKQDLIKETATNYYSLPVTSGWIITEVSAFSLVLGFLDLVGNCCPGMAEITLIAWC